MDEKYCIVVSDTDDFHNILLLYETDVAWFYDIWISCQSFPTLDRFQNNLCNLLL